MPSLSPRQARPSLTAGKRHYKGKPFKISPATIALVMVSLIVCFLAIIRLSSHAISEMFHSLPSCQDPFTIWSHRGYVSKYENVLHTTNAETCTEALTELQMHGIRHLDMDIDFQNGETLVSHPSESHGFSPCTNVKLDEFLSICERLFGPRNFFVSLEPKALWNITTTAHILEEHPDALAAPEHVMGGILNTLEHNHDKIPPSHCGLIVTPEQWKSPQLIALQERMKQHCDHLALPMSQTRGIRDLDSYPTSLLKEPFTMTMPGMEFFEGPPKPSKFLSHSMPNANNNQWDPTKKSTKIQNILWVVDTLNDMRKALSLPNVHGVVSNQPIKAMAHYQTLCQQPYHVPDLGQDD